MENGKWKWFEATLLDWCTVFFQYNYVSRSSWIHSTWSARITLHIVHADQLKRAATGALIMLILLRDSWVEQGAVQQSRTELFMWHTGTILGHSQAQAHKKQINKCIDMKSTEEYRVADIPQCIQYFQRYAGNSLKADGIPREGCRQTRRD